MFVEEAITVFLQSVEEAVGLIVSFILFTLFGLPAATIALLVTFEIEAILDKLARDRPAFERFGATQIVVATESVWWLLSFLLIDVSAVLAGVFLVVTMVFQHTWEDNLAHGRGTFTPFVDLEMVPHSLIEGVIAGGLWLYVASGQAGLPVVAQQILAAVLLIVALDVEHVLGRRLALLIRTQAPLGAV